MVHVQPGKRDFTIYVLDPLEARNIAPAILAGSGAPSARAPHGVAMGLGLLSSALHDPECDVAVTGTIVGDGLQEDRLEVVFSLREVRSRRAASSDSI